MKSFADSEFVLVSIKYNNMIASIIMVLLDIYLVIMLSLICSSPNKQVLEPELLNRLIQHAITHRVFKEPEKGFVEYTAISRLLDRPRTYSWMGVGCEEM